jgi:hypothetical protein
VQTGRLALLGGRGVGFVGNLSSIVKLEFILLVATQFIYTMPLGMADFVTPDAIRC